MRNLVAIVLLVSSQFAYAQPALKYPNYSQHFHQGLRYGLFKPSSYDPKKSYPLIVYMHGSTDTVSRDNYWYRDDRQKEHAAFVLTPKCVESNQGWGNTWESGQTPAAVKTLSLVDSIVAKYNIDKSRLYVYGISMGGFGVFSMLAKNPGKFAAAYAICGGSDTKAASKLLNVPLWIFHGSDDDVVPVRLSRDINNEIVRLGGKKVKYTEYPGVKHNSWDNANQEPDLVKWLFEQTLSR